MNQEIFAQVTAIKQLLLELPNIIGMDEYHRIEAEVLVYQEEFDKTEDKEQQAELALKLMRVIWNYPDASNRFNQIKTDTDICNKVLKNLSLILPSLGFDQQISRKLSDITTNPSTRIIVIQPGGQGKTKSIKVGNLDFDFGEFGQLAAGIILAAQDVVEKPNPLLIATGIILISASIYSASTKEISEQEATVFWGFIKLVEGGKKYASSEEIWHNTNIERGKLFLTNLSINEVKASLLKLKNIYTVNQMGLKGNYWQITEKYHIKRK